MKAKKFIMKTKFHGEPKLSDFEMVQEELPEINNGEFLCQAEYISVDPFIRLKMPALGEGRDVVGFQVAKIVESKSSKYPVGSYILGQLGWRSHTIVNEDNTSISIVSDIGDLPKSLYLGVLGMTGNTAYFGLLRVGRPNAGETVVVSGAAGAVGSTAGQIARIKGCKVIGFAGSDEKCDFLTKELGFDHAINYKKGNIADALKAAAPDGIDCYFDNVGGELSRTITKQMNSFGRVAIAGSISNYNEDDPVHDEPVSHADEVNKNLSVEKFVVVKWIHEWPEAQSQNLKWIEEGKLRYKEYVTQGFENTPRAFIGMLRGENTGKAVVKV